jgi:hypothetical protein
LVPACFAVNLHFSGLLQGCKGGRGITSIISPSRHA